MGVRDVAKQGWFVFMAAIVALGVAASVTLTGNPAFAVDPADCDRFASPTGNDANSGTSVGSPLRSVGALVNALQPGQMGCLRGSPAGSTSDGTQALYEGTVMVTNGGTQGNPIIVRSYPGEIAHVKGELHIDAADVVFSQLVLDGRNAGDDASPQVTKSRVTLFDNNITTRNSAPCVSVSGLAVAHTRGVRVEHNRIHDCKGNALSAQESDLMSIRSNVIYDNSATGLALFPNVDTSLIAGNIVDRNLHSLVLGPGSDQNAAIGNVTSRPVSFNVTASGGVGTTNVFSSNCSYKPGSTTGGIDTSYVSNAWDPTRIWTTANVIASPNYQNPDEDYKPQASSTCRQATGDMSAAASDGERPDVVEGVNLRPNVLFIVTDDQRAVPTADNRSDTLPEQEMPETLKWFKTGNASEGITGGTEFTRGFATTPACCPSRASIFSGRYVHTHGVTSNGYRNYNNPSDPRHNPEQLDNYDQATTIQAGLKSAGYRTAIYGKYLNAWVNDTAHGYPNRGAPPFFDDFAIFEGGYGQMPVLLPDGGSGAQMGTTGNIYSTTYVKDKGENFIQNPGTSDSTPWFMYLAPFAPHDSGERNDDPNTPAFEEAWLPMTEGQPFHQTSLPGNDVMAWPPPGRPAEGDLTDKPTYIQDATEGIGLTRTMFERADQRGLIQQQLRTMKGIDTLVAGVMAKLRAEGEEEDTIAVFIGDNGHFWREHGISWDRELTIPDNDCGKKQGVGVFPKFPQCGLTGKGKPYTEAVQVPYLMRWPGNPQVRRDFKDSRLVANIDLGPTIRDAVAAAPVPGGSMDGISLLGSSNRSRILLEQISEDDRAWLSIRTPTYQYIEHYGDPLPQPGYPPRTDNPATTEVDETIFREYYDLVSDPFMYRNLYGPDGISGTADDDLRGPNGVAGDGDDLAAVPSHYPLSAQLEYDLGCQALTCPPTGDSIAPKGTDVDAVNGATTPGKVETGDRIVYRFDKPIDPRSLFTGWNGAGTRTVDVMFDADLQTDPDDFDHVRILGVNGEALGVLDLARSNYVGVTDVHFNTSELDLSADFRTVTITLDGATVGAEWTDGARMVWQPTALIEDLAGNPLNTAAPVLEQDTPSGGTDRDF